MPLKPYLKKSMGTVIKNTPQKTYPCLPLNSFGTLHIDIATLWMNANQQDAIQQIKQDLARFQTAKQLASNQKQLAKELVLQHINTMWSRNARLFITATTFQFCQMLQSMDTNRTSKDFSAEGIQTAFSDFTDTCKTEYLKWWDTYTTKVDVACDQVVETISQWNTDIEKLIVQSGRTVGDIAHRLDIQATLDCMRSIGCTSYRYICENSITSCSVCEGLDGQIFDIDDAKEGENLPPMHPNCRCTISITPETVAQWGRYLDLLAESYTSSLSVINNPLTSSSNLIDGTAGLIGVGWNAAVGDDLMRYHGSTTTTTINGTEYRINYETFNNVSLDQNGFLIDPSQAFPQDMEALTLMRNRDTFSSDSAEYQQIQSKLDERKAVPGQVSIDVNRSYDFYVLGEDVTERLNAYMRQTEITYAAMHDKFWELNLLAFYNLVKLYAEMDLKNQPEWQHSAYIYNGEIVDQDALGNINYGYFGRHCNFPELVLVSAGGFGQIIDGTVDWSEITTFFDDPRDAYRVKQGIELYRLWH